VADILEIQQLNKIISMLGDIKKVNGYLNDIREVNKVETDPEQIQQFPAVNLVMGDLEYPKYESGHHMKRRTYILDTYFRANDAQAAQEIGLKLVADFEIRFADTTINGNTNYRQTANAYNLENTCLTVYPVSVTLWDASENSDLYNIGWEFEVHFRQRADNPTLQK